MHSLTRVHSDGNDRVFFGRSLRNYDLHPDRGFLEQRLRKRIGQAHATMRRRMPRQMTTMQRNAIRLSGAACTASVRCCTWWSGETSPSREWKTCRPEVLPQPAFALHPKFGRLDPTSRSRFRYFSRCKPTLNPKEIQMSCQHRGPPGSVAVAPAAIVTIGGGVVLVPQRCERPSCTVDQSGL